MWLMRRPCDNLEVFDITADPPIRRPVTTAETIPVESIVGTIARCCDFDRCFRPLRRHLKKRTACCARRSADTTYRLYGSDRWTTATTWSMGTTAWHSPANGGCTRWTPSSFVAVDRALLAASRRAVPSPHRRGPVPARDRSSRVCRHRHAASDRALPDGRCAVDLDLRLSGSQSSHSASRWMCSRQRRPSGVR